MTSNTEAHDIDVSVVSESVVYAEGNCYSVRVMVDSLGTRSVDLLCEGESVHGIDLLPTGVVMTSNGCKVTRDEVKAALAAFVEAL